MSRRFVLVVAFPPGEETGECLELVLAAAALDVEVDILFRGPGRGHLESEPVRPWLQLPDFGLAGLWYEIGDGFTPAGQTPAGALDDPGVAELCRDRTVLVL